MFFIGIFGVEDKEKEVKKIHNHSCCKCGRLTSSTLIKRYSYFHIFFIPLFKWGEKYYLKQRCCGTVYEVLGEEGKKLELGELEDLSCASLKEVYSSEGYSYSYACTNCGKNVDSSFLYCPYCGEKMR